MYQSLGSYKIRVYQLSEGNLQHVSAAAVSASQDGPTTPFMQTALLSKMSAQGSIASGLTVSGVQSNFQQMLAQGSNSGTSAAAQPVTSPAAQAASDAYMLYCHTVDIIPVEDLAGSREGESCRGAVGHRVSHQQKGSALRLCMRPLPTAAGWQLAIPEDFF